MFSIHEQPAKLHFTSRSEKNGENRIPAATLAFTFNAPNDVLSEFSPDLKASLYRHAHPGEGDMADEADPRAQDPNYLPRLKFPGMRNDIKLDTKIVGATVTLHHGIGGKSDLVLDECKVDAFEFIPQDGGTVIVSLNVACKPSTKYAGDLHGMQDQDVVVTIEPPREDQASLV